MLSLPDFCGGDSAAPQEFAASSNSSDVQGEKSCRLFHVVEMIRVGWRVSARCVFMFMTVYLYDGSSNRCCLDLFCFPQEMDFKNGYDHLRTLRFSMLQAMMHKLAT